MQQKPTLEDTLDTVDLSSNHLITDAVFIVAGGCNVVTNHLSQC